MHIFHCIFNIVKSYEIIYAKSTLRMPEKRAYNMIKYFEEEERMDKRYVTNTGKFGFALGYGGANFVYDLITFYMLFYLTDMVGLNAGIIGTMMLFTRVFDGITDIIMGTVVDRTHTKWGKARPWKFLSFFGCAITTICCFAIPVSWEETAQYIFFFVSYIMFNAVFYTMWMISHTTMLSLMTKNNKERVQLNSWHYCAAMVVYFFVVNSYSKIIEALGGGLEGWKRYAIIMSAAGLVLNIISVALTKELPDEELNDGQTVKNPSLGETVKNLKYVVTNKYFLLILAAYILQYVTNTCKDSSALYFMKYIMGNMELYGIFASVQILPKLVGSALMAFLILKMGMYKLNLYGTGLALLGFVGNAVFGFLGFFPGMLTCTLLAGVGMSAFSCDGQSMLATANDYTYRKTGKNLMATFQAAGSVGIKIGSGIGSAIAGWMLAAGGYVANAEVQPASSILVIKLMFLVVPAILFVVMFIVMSQIKVEKAIAELDKKDGYQNK